jgi:hypothetical protein
LLQEVLPEQQSDDGLDDIVADQAAAMMHYNAALAAVSFDDDEPAPHRTLWFSVFRFRVVV